MSDSFELKDKFEKIFIIIQHLSHDDFLYEYCLILFKAPYKI